MRWLLPFCLLPGLVAQQRSRVAPVMGREVLLRIDDLSAPAAHAAMHATVMHMRYLAYAVHHGHPGSVIATGLDGAVEALPLPADQRIDSAVLLARLAGSRYRQQHLRPSDHNRTGALWRASQHPAGDPGRMTEHPRQQTSPS
ncbi:MAG: hypothetical protein ACOCXA_04860 [Planctomycetota bacterium]